jgi:hypothetical protein
VSKRRERRVAAKTRRITQAQAVRHAQRKAAEARRMEGYYAKRCREIMAAELAGETVLPEGYLHVILSDMRHKLAREMAERIARDNPELTAKLGPALIHAAQELLSGLRPMYPGHLSPRYDRRHDPLMDRAVLRVSVPPLDINYAVPMDALIAAR